MKTIVYIDAANIILSAKRINFDLDLGKLFIYLKNKYRECKILFFTGNVLSLQEIEPILNEHRVEVCITQVAKEGGRLKANCDVDLANKLTIDVERNAVDFVIIMSADGDFAILFDYALSMGKLTKCFAVNPENTSIFLRRREWKIKLTFLNQIPKLQKEKSLDRDKTL